jgi:hypothetical protein
MFSVNRLIAVLAEESQTMSPKSQNDADKLPGHRVRHYLPSHTHLADSCHISRTIVDLALAQRLFRSLSESESGRKLLAAFKQA